MLNITSPLVDASQKSLLERVDPRLKLALLAWVSTLSVICDSTPALVILALVGALLGSALRLPRRQKLLLVLLVAGLAWGTMLSQAVFFAGTPRTVFATLIAPRDWGGWHFPGVVLYQAGFRYGLKQSLRMIAVTLTGLSVCLSTSPERLFAALAHLRVPAALGFMTVSALRMLPLLTAEYAIVRQARWLRGGGAFRSAPGGRWRWPANELALLVPVLAGALRRASTLATSVSSRGFDPAAPRSFYPALTFHTAEKAILLLLIGSWIAVCVAKLLYWLYVADLYYQSALRPLYTWAREWL